MDPQRVKQMLKKYDLNVKTKALLQKILQNRKIHKKHIRDNFCIQDDKMSKVFCLLKGSVKIYYKIFHQLCRQVDRNKQKQREQNTFMMHKNPIFEEQNITFANIDSEYEIINDYILLQFLKNEANRFGLRGPQQNDFQNDQINNKTDNSAQFPSLVKRKAVRLTNKYSIIVTSSQCEYIQLSFQQAQTLLLSRIPFIKSRDSQRQAQIKRAKQQQKDHNAANQKRNLLEKMSLPNISLKNIHQAHEIYEIKDFLHRKQQLSRSNQQAIHDINIKRNNNQTQQCSKVKPITLNPSPKMSKHAKIEIPHYKMKTVSNEQEGHFSGQNSLLHQNQKILQRYRSMKALQTAPKTHNYSQALRQKGNYNFTEDSIGNKIHKSTDQRLFKEHLKRIIKKKLKFQSKHGQIIKQNRIDNKYLPGKQHKNRPNPQKQTGKHPRQMMQVKSSKMGAFDVYDGIANDYRNQNGQKKQVGLIRAKRNTQSIQQIIANLQSKTNQINQSQILKKKLESESMLLHFQNLDTYFDRID